MPQRDDDFSAKTKRLLMEQANMICSNPSCRRLTGGFHSAENKSVNYGEACHICAASPNGPRYNPFQKPEERKSPHNGIWLCILCARMIDRDLNRYTVELLQEWKTQHVVWIDEQRETDVTRRTTLLEERRQYLVGLRTTLIKVQDDHDSYFTDNRLSEDTDGKIYKIIINKAVNVCNLAGDIGDDDCRRCLSYLAGSSEFDRCSRECEKRLAYIAVLRLTPNRVVGVEGPQQKLECERWGTYESRNRNALIDAISRIIELIDNLS